MSAIVGKKIMPEYIENDILYIQKVVLDISKIRNEVGWKPSTSLQKGIERTWRWLTNL